MRATFEWSLPEEREDYEMYSQSGKLYSAVWDYAQWLRQVCKHGDPNEHNAEDCREKFYEILREHDYDL